nr:hypothetical protein [Tanacetum cinerariifolium]
MGFKGIAKVAKRWFLGCDQVLDIKGGGGKGFPPESVYVLCKLGPWEEEKKDAEDPGNEDNKVLNNIVDENIVYGCANDPNMPNFEEIVYSDDDEDVGTKADMTNLDSNIPVSPIPTTRIYKDHLVKKIIGDIHLVPQTRRMIKNVTNYGNGPTWIFDIDTLTKSMNYKPVVAWNQSNGSAGKARVETVPDKYYILLPLWTQGPLLSSSS